MFLRGESWVLEVCGQEDAVSSGEGPHYAFYDEGAEKLRAA